MIFHQVYVELFRPDAIRRRRVQALIFDALNKDAKA
jgi:hypothetical protein